MQRIFDLSTVGPVLKERAWHVSKLPANDAETFWFEKVASHIVPVYVEIVCL